MKIRFKALHDPKYDYIDSIFEVGNQTVKQTYDCWKHRAILKFVFEGKKLEVDEGCLVVEMDELDMEFWRIVKVVDASYYGFWRKIYDMLEQGISREEVLKWAFTNAIARELK